MSKFTGLNNYKRYIGRHFKNRFPCFFCGVSVSADSYENHCTSTRHPIDVKTCCVWCRSTSWRKGKKYENVQHLQACVQNFFAPSSSSTATVSPADSSSSPPSPSSSSDSTTTTTAAATADVPIFDETPEFETKNFFGHAPLPDPGPFRRFVEYDVPARYLMRFDTDTMRILDDVNRVTFRNLTLNEAARIVLYYLLTTRRIIINNNNNNNNNSSDPPVVVPEKKWSHVMIRRVAIDSFYENLERFDGGLTEIAPFYCYCRGGPFEDHRFNEHVHLLVATVEPHFGNRVWSRVRPSDRPHSNYKCKYSKPVASPLHLANAMGYVSRRRSRCEFARRKSTSAQLNHFYLNRSLPRHYKFVLATLWESGVRELVDKLYQNYEPLFDANYLDDESGGAVVLHGDGRWKIQYRHLPDLVERLESIPPLSPHLLPAEENESSSVTNSFLFLGEGVKMCLEEYPPDVEFSPREQYVRARKYIERAKRAYFVFRPRVQRERNKIRMAVDRAVRALKTSLESKEAEMERLCATKDEEIERLRATIGSKDAEIKQLKNRLARKRTRHSSSSSSSRSDSGSDRETKAERIIYYRCNVSNNK